MMGITAKLEITAHGLPREMAFAEEQPRRAILEVLEYAHEQGGLAAPQPWVMASRPARELEERFGYAPAGGWGRLVALMAGADLFEAETEQFVPRTPVALVEQYSNEELQVALLEAFTRGLCPPQSMAGMLVALDVHPMWGLRVAHDVRTRGLPRNQIRDEKLFPRPALKLVSQMIYGSVAAFFSVLNELKSDHSYPLDPMVGLFYECAEVARQVTRERLEKPGPLPIFLSSDFDGVRPTTDFVQTDLFDAVLVPANLAKFTGDGRVVMRTDLIKRAQVGEFSRAEAEAWGAWLESFSEVRHAC